MTILYQIYNYIFSFATNFLIKNTEPVVVIADALTVGDPALVTYAVATVTYRGMTGRHGGVVLGK